MSDFLDDPFEPEKEEGSQPFQLIPTGRHKAEIVKASAAPTKNGRGKGVTLTWLITEGEFENRTIVQLILLEHENAEAMKIGRQKLKDVVTAIGITEAFSDLKLLLNRPCMISVRITQDKNGQYPDKNEIGRVSPIPTARKR
jgi:hypothetical protein